MISPLFSLIWFGFGFLNPVVFFLARNHTGGITEENMIIVLIICCGCLVFLILAIIMLINFMGTSGDCTLWKRKE